MAIRTTRTIKVEEQKKQIQEMQIQEQQEMNYDKTP